MFSWISLLEKLYINGKYGTRFDVGRVGCNAIITKAYVQPEGTLFPCQDVAKEIGKGLRREQTKSAGLASWDQFDTIASSLYSKDTYKNYVPCSRCPALGLLCLPCPLPGLRGLGNRQQQCVAAWGRAKKDGVDLRKAIERAASDSVVDRVRQDPLFRREFFSQSDPKQWLTRHGAQGNDSSALANFQGETLGEIVDLLQARVAKHSGYVVGRVDDAQGG
jgi:radical SAM protein with 4Fe4S-binding SPASM domain